ncbi:primosomal protein DnaI [Fredinandcohnia quinoae]|uniref:Primosomal protein DnaI n=1 Tax=Fredinandcohnia quinoae TaxID=2918902 RepID=A0AAW5E311_9BACI|nr:primosomal protein DnaI [Fredinandcohnia sp. SECRCQ15]MCH1627302.1 primosomal protein DnaI [Fredinandcohnia sp. SECRCQ15]
MKPVQDSLKKLANNANFQQQYEKIKHEVLNNPQIRSFLNDHRDEITNEMINRSLVKLYEFIGQSKNCDQCASLDQCKNMLKGYHPHLKITGKNIDVQYEPCSNKLIHDEQMKFKSLIKSVYIPNDILHATFNRFEVDEDRQIAITAALDFVDKYEPGKRIPAIYYHGPFGTGKTYLLGAIANKLAEKNIASMLVYVPEFMRELKGAIQNQTLNEKLEAVKRVPVLMLDDIGAESMSSWARDEVLGTILQFRMLENLPTFFTSNFDLKELEHHLSYSQRGEEEKVKAARIMERIKYLAKPIELRGENRRY